MDIPILLLIFNRPETTARVFSMIRRIRPKKLFIAADGPRRNIPGDRTLCKEVRRIVAEIDWPCEVKKLYRNKNLGCKKAVSSAIDWFFKKVEGGIILEDDCLPTSSFFKFCEKMLKDYSEDQTVMHVTGDNFLMPRNQVKNGYYFSRYAHIWGWATWRRAWVKYDVGMSDWPRMNKQGKIDHFLDSLWEKEYWHTLFDAVYKGRIDTWDYQWLYAIWKNGGRAITPGVNLVENIGHGKNSTHLVYRNFRPHSEEISFPLVLIKNKQKKFDTFISKTHYGINLPMILYQKAKFLFA